MKTNFTNQKGTTIMKTRKLLSLTLALLMLFGMMLPTTMTALAAGENATLTINAPAGSGYTLAAGDFKAYKIMGVVKNGDSYAYADDAFDFAGGCSFAEYMQVMIGFMMGEGFSEAEAIGVFNSILASYIDPVYGEYFWDAFMEVDYQEVFDSFFLRNGVNPDDAFEAIAIPAVQNGTGSVKFENLDHGYYFVTGKVTAGGQEVIAYSNMLTVAQANVAVDVKVDAPTIKKEADKETAKIGDTLNYTLSSKVPAMEGYEEYTFILHDKMSKGLTFNDDVYIEIDGVEYTDDNYTVSVEDILEGEEGFEEVVGTHIKITFIDFIDLKGQAGDEIVITYSAKLNEDAVSGANSNKAYIEYSTDPYWDGEGEEPTGTTPTGNGADVYTFELNIKSIDGKTKAVLPGTKFNLKDGGSNVKLVDLGGGNYRIATPEEAAGTLGEDYTETLEAPASGEINILGIDEGTYNLVEIFTPEGYNKAPDTEIVIEHLGDGEYEVNGVDGTEAIVIVEHFSGSMLPGTGGIGTTIFYIVGISLALSLAAAFVIRRKRNALSALNAK